MSLTPEILEAVREQAGGPGARAYLADVGNWLRQRGAPVPKPLSKYLAAFQGFCHVSGSLVTFGEGPLPLVLPQPHQLTAPSDASSGVPSVRQDLFEAMVSSRATARALLDLETVRVIQLDLESDEMRSLVVEQPERFISIPQISREQQREWATHALADVVGAEQAEELTSDPHWYVTFRTSGAPALQRIVALARRKHVAELARAWLREHGLPENRFVSMRTTQQTKPVPAAPVSRSLREAVHRAVERMTDDELAALLIPARLLVEDHEQRVP